VSGGDRGGGVVQVGGEEIGFAANERENTNLQEERLACILRRCWVHSWN
jgi:hypothetical protein